MRGNEGLGNLSKNVKNELLKQTILSFIPRFNGLNVGSTYMHLLFHCKL